MRYDKHSIKAGVFMTLACPIEAAVVMSDDDVSKSRSPPSYGTTPLTDIRTRMDVARDRLITLAASIRAAKRR